MEVKSAYEVLGLEPSASASDIKTSYKNLAKLYHPDRNNSVEATSQFQLLNNAYHTLLDIVSRNACSPNIPGDVQLCPVSFQTKHNTFCVTIDVVDYMFLVIYDSCRRSYTDVSPCDRKEHGVQMLFQYSSPNESGILGSVSLTFYASTATLHVQGSSYILWTQEHLPLILANADEAYRLHPSSWDALTLDQKVGANRKRARQTRSFSREGTLDTSLVLPSILDHTTSSSAALFASPPVLQPAAMLALLVPWREAVNGKKSH